MSIRPGQARGPWVGTSGGGGTGDHKVMVEAADALAEYLIDKIVGSGGITATSFDKGGGIEAVQINGAGVTGDHKLLIDGSDTTAAYLSSKLLVTTASGISLTIQNPLGNENILLAVTLTGSNVGVGTGQSFKQKNASGNLEFKTLLAGTNITSVVNGTDEITINAATQTGDHKVLRSAADSTADYLSGKIVGGTGISLTTLNPGGNEQIQINATGGATVKVSSDDTTAGYLEDKIATEGLQTETEVPAGNERLDIRAIPGYFDDFYLPKPFWYGTQALTSGDFTIDSVNHYLTGAAENNSVDWIRCGIEGDFDYKVKLNTNGATTGGLQLIGSTSVTVTWYLIPGSTILRRTATGESNLDVTYLTTTVWLRISRRGRTLKFWYRQNDTDAWVLSEVLTKDLGFDGVLSLKSMTNGRVYYVQLWDNGFPERARSSYTKSVPLTDGATITPDLRQGNLLTVTLGGNRTIDNPTACFVSNGFIWVIRLRQDASPPRTVTWGSKFRWSAGIAPTLTAIANKSDYFVFAYNETDDKWDCIGQAYNL